MPVDKLGYDTPRWLPYWYRKGSFHIIRWSLVGGFRRLGLPGPRHGLHDKMTVSDRGIVEAIRPGRVVTRSHVTSLSGGIATFANHRQEPERIDTVIFATGFGRRYPLLCRPDASNDEVANALAFRIFHPTEPGLIYLAETVGLRSCWPIFGEQANAIVSYLLSEQRHEKRSPVQPSSQGRNPQP